MTTLQGANHRMIGRRRPLTLGPIVAVLAVAAALFSGSAAAQDADGDEPAAAPEQVVIFVIDLSGSMNQPFDDARSKLDVAKKVFAEAFTKADQEALVGLRVFGDQFPAQPPDARIQNCSEDTRLVSPPAVIDRGPLIDEVLSLEARGDTAIALALQAANDDIPEGTLGTVVLFSDGRDECFDADLDGDPASGPSYGEDPCEVAKNIAGDGVDLRIDRINTVGLRTDAAAEFELRCIADATGGSFTPIDTDEDVEEASSGLAETASPRLAERLGGLSIVGTPSQEAAPEFGRLDDGSTTGRYTDSIAMNSEKWYRFAEYGPGDGTFTATAFGLPAQEGIEFGMRLYLPESDRTFFASRSDSNAGLPQRPTVSIRCPGCSVSRGPNEVYWVVSLTTENEALGGTYDLELLTEGPGFGGVSTSCNEGQECWYEAQIAERQAALESIQEEIDAAQPEGVTPGLVEDRDRLSDEVASLRDELTSAESTAESDESEAGLARLQAGDLRLQVDNSGDGGASLTMPLLLALVGLAAGGIALFLRRPNEQALLTPDLASSSDSAVIGAVTGHAEPPTPAPEPPSAASAPPEVIDEGVVAGGRAFDAGPEALEVPLPGWYDDPDDPRQLRWWDGTDWTDNTQAQDAGGQS